jgi:hypothetical protein
MERRAHSEQKVGPRVEPEGDTQSFPVLPGQLRSRWQKLIPAPHPSPILLPISPARADCSDQRREVPDMGASLRAWVPPFEPAVFQKPASRDGLRLN